jgi:hypothetical protein
MPYIQRNNTGEVVALTTSSHDGAGEWAESNHPEVLLFLAGKREADRTELTNNLELLAADLSMIRVIEDVIDILISKNIIIFSELPLPVQEKLLKKKGHREKLFGVGDILSNDDGLL